MHDTKITAACVLYGTPIDTSRSCITTDYLANLRRASSIDYICFIYQYRRSSSFPSRVW